MGKLRVFARFHSQTEHDALVDGLLMAQRLRAQIELYKSYRQQGLRTLEQVRKFENERKNLLKNRKPRESMSTDAEQRTTVATLFESTDIESQKSKKRGRPPKQLSSQQQKVMDIDDPGKYFCLQCAVLLVNIL